jgi:hypothetical protein
MSTFITIIGTLGAVALLYGYGMVSMGKMSPDGLTYQVLNVVGAGTLALNTGYHAAWPSAILNLVWSLIGVLTLSRLVARGAARRQVAPVKVVLQQSPGSMTADASAREAEPEPARAA